MQIDFSDSTVYDKMRIGCKLEMRLMEKYQTRQRKRLLEYLSEHTDEQMTAHRIGEALTADNISISAVYRNLSALEEDGLLKRSVRERTREVFYQYIAAEECKAVSYTHLDAGVRYWSIEYDKVDTDGSILLNGSKFADRSNQWGLSNTEQMCIRDRASR